MLTSYSSFVTAVARWCNGPGLLCLIFTSISLFCSSLWEIDLAVTVAGSCDWVNINYFRKPEKQGTALACCRKAGAMVPYLLNTAIKNIDFLRHTQLDPTH